MKKEHMQLTVIGVGLPLMIFFLITNLRPVVKKPAAAVTPVAAPADTAVPVVQADTRAHGKETALQAKRWEAAWGRDPFWSASDNTGRLSEFELKGISFSQNKKGYAFINDQIVSAGDSLGGYEVSRIEKDRVLLMRGAQTFILTFSDNQ